jgi:hypothetical protein
VVAFTIEHHGLDAVRQRAEERLDTQDGRIVEGSACAREREDGDVVARSALSDRGV